MSDLSQDSIMFCVARAVIEKSLEFFQRQGKRGHEGVVLWPGKLAVKECRISVPMIPAQITGPRMYQIPAGESFRIIKATAKQGLVIPIQVHSHPRSAFHSEADDELAFLQHLNAVSIVVPDFGNFDATEFLKRAVFYRLRGPDRWDIMEEAEIQRCFSFENTDGLD